MIRLHDLGHTYRGAGLEARTVLDIGDWTFDVGQQVLLRGVSGSGKTTLLNVLAGLLRPSRGDVWIGEHSLYAMPEAQRDRFRARSIGYVFQTHHLLPSLTALENVVMPLAFARRLPAAHWTKRAADLLAQVGLSDFLHHRPARLSTGQRLRVAIARALANEPPVLLADEPTAALDAQSTQLVMDMIQSVCRERSAVLIVASHDPSLAARFDAIFDLRAGQLQPASIAPGTRSQLAMVIPRSTE